MCSGLKSLIGNRLNRLNLAISGAWDYAKDDPDGLLGGPMEASKVGLFGFSKGGFTALNAFGLEGQIPAVWVDGAPSEPKTVYGYGLRRFLGGETNVDNMMIGDIDNYNINDCLNDINIYDRWLWLNL